MLTDILRQQIRQFLSFSIPEAPVAFVAHDMVEESGYRRIRVSYASPEGEPIPAFLLLPQGDGPFAAVLIHHQHNSQRHFGKSEVCGLVGDPLQAFGPALAREGFVVLAPDSICFEDRRTNRNRGSYPPGNLRDGGTQVCERSMRSGRKTGSRDHR